MNGAAKLKAIVANMQDLAGHLQYGSQIQNITMDWIF